MKIALIKSAAVLVIAAMLTTPCAFADSQGMEIQDDQIKAGEMVTDTVLVRPLGIVSTIVGFGFFIVSSPFSALGGNTDEAWDTMVAKPARFTFKRRLGDFD